MAIALARFDSDGNLDGSFGSDGKVTSSLGGGNDLAFGRAVARQRDGKLVMGGFHNQYLGSSDWGAEIGRSLASRRMVASTVHSETRARRRFALTAHPRARSRIWPCRVTAR